MSIHAAKESAIREAVRCAKAVIAGEINVLEGCVALSQLADDVVPSWLEDPDFQIFGAVASESDAIPLGAVRQQWQGDVLSHMDTEAQRYSAVVREEVLKACENVVARFPEFKEHAPTGNAV